MVVSTVKQRVFLLLQCWSSLSRQIFWVLIFVFCFAEGPNNCQMGLLQGSAPQPPCTWGWGVVVFFFLPGKGGPGLSALQWHSWDVMFCTIVVLLDEACSMVLDTLKTINVFLKVWIPYHSTVFQDGAPPVTHKLSFHSLLGRTRGSKCQGWNSLFVYKLSTVDVCGPFQVLWFEYLRTGPVYTVHHTTCQRH